MIYVIGGIALDIIVYKDKFIKNTSNISEINLSIGGVGFNIFKNINSNKKCFISIIGDDEAGQLIISSLKKFSNYKISILKNNYYLNNNSNLTNNFNSQPHIFLKVLNKSKTPFYNAFMQKGELLYGASNFSYFENFTNIDYILKTLKNIKQNDIVVIDSNLNKKLINNILEFLNNKNTFIFFETISVEKAYRTSQYLKNIFFISPEQNELKALLKNFIKNNKTYKFNFFKSLFFKSNPIKELMLKNNINFILKTMGKKGSILYFIKNKSLKKINFLPTEILKIKNSNGAGDFMLSKIIEHFYYSSILNKNKFNKKEFFPSSLNNIKFLSNIKFDKLENNTRNIIYSIFEATKETESYLKTIN